MELTPTVKAIVFGPASLRRPVEDRIREVLRSADRKKADSATRAEMKYKIEEILREAER